MVPFLSILREPRYTMIDFERILRTKGITMRKQTTVRRRPGRRRGRSRTHSHRPAARKQSTLGLRLLLVGVLLVMGVWALMRVPPGLLILGSIAVLVVII